MKMVDLYQNIFDFIFRTGYVQATTLLQSLLLKVTQGFSLYFGNMT